jgi:hypothetical protein
MFDLDPRSADAPGRKLRPRRLAPDLPGCMGDGGTVDEALAECRLAALGWLDGEARRRRMS